MELTHRKPPKPAWVRVLRMPLFYGNTNVKGPQYFHWLPSASQIPNCCTQYCKALHNLIPNFFSKFKGPVLQEKGTARPFLTHLADLCSPCALHPDTPSGPLKGPLLHKALQSCLLSPNPFAPWPTTQHTALKSALHTLTPERPKFWGRWWSLALIGLRGFTLRRLGVALPWAHTWALLTPAYLACRLSIFQPHIKAVLSTLHCSFVRKSSLSCQQTNRTENMISYSLLLPWYPQGSTKLMRGQKESERALWH